jgi:hypothetical protein
MVGLDGKRSWNAALAGKVPYHKRHGFMGVEFMKEDE